MPPKPTEDAFLTVPSMSTFDQATVTVLEVACGTVTGMWSMTAVYETDVAVGLVTVQAHVVPVSQGVPTTVLPFRRMMWKKVGVTLWFAVAVSMTPAPGGTHKALAARVTAQSRLGETVPPVGLTGSQGLPAFVVGAQSAGSWVVVT
jgi:hypothetical protein